MEKYSVSFFTRGGVPCANIVEAPSAEIAVDYFKDIANAEEKGYTNISATLLNYSIKPGQPVHTMDYDWLVNYCIELHENTKTFGNAEIIDADTILADMVYGKVSTDCAEYQDVGIALLKTYRDSADKVSVIATFELLADVIFFEYVETVALNTTRKSEVE